MIANLADLIAHLSERQSKVRLHQANPVIPGHSTEYATGYLDGEWYELAYLIGILYYLREEGAYDEPH